ncbi:MAG: dolichol-phosphate mannosyltransferase [Robiginitomaculum sp.]|nr:MAG: dolichol-phosphate mannosyltransferase [Robiginitomaculum sp.]
MPDQPCEVSVLIPVCNEADNIGPLAKEVVAALGTSRFELIMIDDASTDHSLDVLRALQTEIPQLRVLHHSRNAGQSHALRSGALAARGSILCTLDGDGQNVPADLPALLRHLQRADAPEPLAMVAGQRQGRQDPPSKRLGSWLANQVRKGLLKDECADTGCGIKAMYRSHYLRLPFFDHQHRYLPALMRREGYKVEYLPVQHRARQFGSSNYSNFGRLLVSFRDLAGLLWLQARFSSPETVEELPRKSTKTKPRT